MPGDAQRGAGGDLRYLLEIFEPAAGHHLNSGKVGTVVEGDENHLLGGAHRAHPARDGIFMTGLAGR